MSVHIHDLYTFYITTPNGETWQTYPRNSRLNWKWVQDDQFGFWRKTLETDLIFRNGSTTTNRDFDKMLAVERSADRCEFILIDIYRICDGEEMLFFPGRMRCAAGEWDESFCKLKIKPEPRDGYTCLVDNWETEYDFAKYITSNTIEATAEFNIERKGCSWTQEGSPNCTFGEAYEHCPDLDDAGSDAWVIEFCNYNLENQFDNIVNVEIGLIREVGAGTCDGVTPLPPTNDPAWILLESDCPTSSTWVRPYYAFGNSGGTEPIADFTIHNAYKLVDVLTYLVDQLPCEINIISNFFNINPDATNPDNVPYQKAALGMADVHLVHLSDFIKDDEDGPDTKATFPYSLNSILKFMPGNIQLEIEGDTLRIEHRSYFRRLKTLDLTVAGHIEMISGKKKHKYDKTKLPKEEKFTWKGETDGPGRDFDGHPIKYSGGCIVKDAKPVTIPFEIYYSNIRFIFERKYLYAENLGGLIILSVGAGKILFDTCPLSGTLKLNGHFAISTLHDNYYKWDRPLPSGVMNNQPTDFYRWTRQKKQDDIKFRLCCDELVTWNPNNLVKTQYGWGEVEEPALEEPKGIFSTTIAHH
jgi:hypothetical protein